MSNDLTGRTVLDGRGAEYTVEHHHLEADELVLVRGEQTHPITLMDIADGPFELVSDD